MRTLQDVVESLAAGTEPGPSMLRLWMAANQLKQHQAAEILGCDRSEISRYLAGSPPWEPFKVAAEEIAGIPRSAW